MWRKKQKEYEIKKARAKALRLRLTCTICGEKAKLNCPCETTQYCSVACQKIDWRDRGHRKACKKIRDERAAEAARADAPTPPSPPKEIVYGPAPRSHADEVRARIAAEHAAARARREANPEGGPEWGRYGSRCPVCLEEWDANAETDGQWVFRCCCARTVCQSCQKKVHGKPCPICRMAFPRSEAEELARLRRHVENEVPEAINHLAQRYLYGEWVSIGVPKSAKKAVKLFKRAVELGSTIAMVDLGLLYERGIGVRLDRNRARQLYQLAADRGSVHAQFNLGNNLRKAGDETAAMSYYKLAANQGLISAWNSVGVVYYNQRNLEESTRWFERAAAAGHEGARRNLEMIFTHFQRDGHGKFL